LTVQWLEENPWIVSQADSDESQPIEEEVDAI